MNIIGRRGFWLSLFGTGLAARFISGQSPKKSGTDAESCPGPFRVLKPGDLTIDPAGNAIRWIVTEKCGDGAKIVTQYSIDMQAASMTADGETRYFNREEAERVCSILAAVAKYTRDSTIWWMEGKGSKTPPGILRVRTGSHFA